ncbi:MAG: pyridoxamine 5'-phosphate oxidase family protein, partial [Candidatus Binatia bacterium]
MLTWSQFRDERPDLAEAGRQLLYQFSVGLAFLGTVRKDGGPRMHPMCPILYEEGLYAFIEPGPKRYDLVRDGRYAMHCFPPADDEDA